LLALCSLSSAAPPRAGGRVNIKAIASRHGLMQMPAESRLSLRRPGIALTLNDDSRRMLFNGEEIWLNAGASAGPAGWTVCRHDADTVLAPLLDPSAARRPSKPITIMLDPGHGGDRTGARRGVHLTEKRVVLDIARRARRALVAAGHKVHLTRSTDIDIPLAERAGLCKAYSADVFVSIHANSAGNTQARGIETYVLAAAGFPSTSGQSCETRTYPGNHYDGANTLLAHKVHHRLLTRTGAADRGMRRARFLVLREAPCPAILVECGFLSNTSEAKKLAMAVYRQTLAEALAAGITEFCTGKGK